MSWTIWAKACKKCHGDLTPESDFYGSYIKCLQCGTITEDGAALAVETLKTSKKKSLAAV